MPNLTIICGAIKMFFTALAIIMLFVMLKDAESVADFREKSKKKAAAFVVAVLGFLQIASDIALVLPNARKIPRAIFKGNLPVIVICVLILLILTKENVAAKFKEKKDLRVTLRVGLAWYLLAVIFQFAQKLIVHLSSM